LLSNRSRGLIGRTDPRPLSRFRVTSAGCWMGVSFFYFLRNSDRMSECGKDD
jgi:hypothetical protein